MWSPPRLVIRYWYETAETSKADMPQPPTTTWPLLAHSPFDELIQQRAVVPDAKPTEEIVPMVPLRPWISAPNLNDRNPSEKVASSTVSSAGGGLSPLAGASGQGKLFDSVAQASPWRDDGADNAVENQVVTSYGHGRKQLPVSAGPADQYTVEEIAQKLNLSPAELAAHSAADRRNDQLMSAIVPADQVLPPAQGSPKSSVVLSRQPVARPLARKCALVRAILKRHYQRCQKSAVGMLLCSRTAEEKTEIVVDLVKDPKGSKFFVLHFLSGDLTKNWVTKIVIYRMPLA